MSQPAVSQLHHELRHSFQGLKAKQAVWNGVLEECAPLLSSLGNLAEQLRSLKSVELSNTPLSSFPNLSERLQHKLLNALDTVLGQLNGKVDALGSVRDSVSKQVSALFQIYEQNSDLLPVSTCVARCALSPSIADMLEWLQDAERHYRIQYIRRKHLLQMLRPDDLTLVQAAPQTWKSLDSPKGDERISDALLEVSFFLERD